MTRKYSLAAGIAGALTLWLASAAMAHAPSGAIFTTLSDGSEVNVNQFPSKEAVYLDGGPGPGAPQTAAGLDDGVYVFQVTDPSGKTLLSTDTAANRRFTVTNGVISGVAPGTHATGTDVDWNATTVQLMPYNDTPNNGGVYKVWVVREADFALGCEANGKTLAEGLAMVDVGSARGTKHGFIPAHCKTDNFKVKKQAIIEIDTRFYDAATGQILDGLGVTWFDTHGAQNKKHSYWAPELLVYHEAHVEAPEPGVHTIVIEDGPGYTIDHIHCPDGSVIDGPGTVQVRVPQNQARDLTIFIDVEVNLE